MQPDRNTLAVRHAVSFPPESQSSDYHFLLVPVIFDDYESTQWIARVLSMAFRKSHHSLHDEVFFSSLVFLQEHEVSIGQHPIAGWCVLGLAVLQHRIASWCAEA